MQRAAEMEVNWEGAGTEVGIQIWRVENTRIESETGENIPVFGIKKWPKSHYGEFYTGDSYVVLHTAKEEDSDALVYDLYFWIGSESTQDEYGVAAYKANELDELLGDAPVQHRELQNHESEDFLFVIKAHCGGIRYMKGGVGGGFRDVDESSDELQLPTRLFHIRREVSERVLRCVEVEVACKSLNEGDAFVLDSGKVIYTWFGSSCSPFEKNKGAEVAISLASVRRGQGGAKVVEDVEDEDDNFWGLLSGKKDDIESAEDYDLKVKKGGGLPEKEETKMYIVRDEDSILRIEKVEVSRSNLVDDVVCLIDTGAFVFVWVGKMSSKREQMVSMTIAQKHIKSLGREETTNIIRVMEGQERRAKGFVQAF